ncbi:hypothetical protein EYF80_060527 [Liparis tanakae]|uniref:Uncharacterized protein n=1 Tax=Liparis tanakae TaxID=230148 RepID=A0A4Z2EKE0_9TELE|nr:hypothetical protein EYF80_060527 [Liparis tanakae]
MSRQRTIWEKTSTLWPPDSSLGSSLSIRTSFPAAWIIACSWKSSASGLWYRRKLSRIFSSAPERQGEPVRWRRSFNTTTSPTGPGGPGASGGLTSMMVSSLGARFFSTSSFSLLNIMGFRMAWSFFTWRTQTGHLESWSPNSSRKVLSEGNCSGSRKFSRLNNSSTEFCRGVPVSRTLFMSFRPSSSLQLRFLRRCASSITTQRQCSFLRSGQSAMIISKVVIRPWNFRTPGMVFP